MFLISSDFIFSNSNRLATWCGPCLLMAPHFEEAAKELEGKVRFCKIDTDKEPDMAARLNVMGLPTLMFLDEVKPEDGAEAGGATAALLSKLEGAITKKSIVELCNFHFFDGPEPAALN
jgi:thiol-disulfide isomerase/thioredoxin